MINKLFLFFCILLVDIHSLLFPAFITSSSQVLLTSCLNTKLNTTCICPPNFLSVNAVPPFCIYLTSITSKKSKITAPNQTRLESVKIQSNCIEKSQNGICIQCKQHYFLTNSSICVRKSLLCGVISPDGTCSSCRFGLVLIKGLCFLNSTIQKKKDPLCQITNNKGQCTICLATAYLASNGKCKQINPLCNGYEPVSGNCIACYIGYTLSNGTCIVSVIDTDPKCTIFNGSTCTNCSQGWFINTNGRCEESDPNCKNFTKNGTCLICQSGYIVQSKNKKCVVNTDTKCLSTTLSICTKCAKGYYVSLGGRCQEINPVCRTLDSTYKYCTSCYVGYLLNLRNCVQSSKIVDHHNCTVYNTIGQCQQCPQRYYIQDGECVKVSDSCNTFDANFGYCTSCFNEYEVNQYGECTSDGS